MARKMAEKGASSIATQKLEDQLTCPVCLDQFTDPRTLPCLHSFCTKCLQKLPLETDKVGITHPLSCPTCRTEAELPQQGVTGFHKAFHLNNLIEIHNLMKKVSGEEKTVCSNCKKEEAGGYCSDCDKFFCPSCDDVHKKWAPTSTHRLMSLTEVSSKAAQMVSVKPEPVMNCPSHGKPLDLYCVTCEQPICYHCTIKSHKKHNHDLVSDAFKQSKAMLKSSLQKVERRITEMKGKKNQLLKNQEQLQKEGEVRKKAINNLCDNYIQGIEKARALGVLCVDTGVQSMVKFGDQQSKALQTHVEELLSCKNHTEHNLKLATPTQVLMTKKQLMARIELLLESDQYKTTPKEFHIDGHQDSSNELDDAMITLPTELTIPFCYPKEVYMQCELVPDFPEVVDCDTTSTATFAILFQSQAILVDKSDIFCAFGEEVPIPQYEPNPDPLDDIVGHEGIFQHYSQLHHNVYPMGDEFIKPRYGAFSKAMTTQAEIPCNVSYLTNQQEVKYEVKFTPEQAGKYSLKFKLAGININAKPVNLMVERKVVSFPYREVKKKQKKATRYS